MKKSDHKLDPIVAPLVRLLLRPKVYYSGVPEEPGNLAEPSLVIVNHTSHLDGPLVTTVLRKARIHNLAAKDRFEQRGFGFFLRHTGCIPIDRQHPDTSWIHESMQVLRNDRESIAIFPEGRHGGYRQQLPFHSGAALLAALSGVPIVMVYVDGPVRILGKRAGMLISRPFHLASPEEGITAGYLDCQTALLENKMKSLMEEYIRLDSGEFPRPQRIVKG
ncbi:MAG: 1-acyl-sn-glycerol-3-phosphate acyltransferase [Bacteroidales bacterium]|nr:1-acyl-sn-glycerol-3-phosphate acyltransferase [Bacteroidales bacterium]